MRKSTLIILSFFIATIASAKCANSGIYCLSKNSSLNRNGIIILEFYASSQTLISNLNKKYPIYLKSAGGKVQLNVVEIFIGEMRLTQIILKPETDLIAGTVYSLEIDNLPKYENKPQRYNKISFKNESITFKIDNIFDNEIPSFYKVPAVEKKTLVYYGCGPASNVYFGISGKDTSELFAKTTVKNKATGKITTYILNIENGLVKVGHGMCSGAFHFDNGENFEITFQLIDQSGNKSLLTNIISFTKPTVSTSEE
jgi:hypothetical protein